MNFISIIDYFGLPTDGYETDLSLVNKAEALKHLIHREDNFSVLTAVKDAHSVDYLNYLLKLLAIPAKSKNIIFIVDTLSLTGSGASADYIRFDQVIEYDSMLMRTSYYEKSHGANLAFNPNATKFLFIPGKPYKYHRIRPIFYLYQKGLLNDNCEWSCYTNHSMRELVYEYVSELNFEEYDTFLRSVTRQLDTIDVTMSTGSYHYNGFPIDSSLYSTTKCSLISETNFNQPQRSKFITEKTWRTVCNKHPFVLLEHAETYRFLESLGIDTFQYAVLHPSNTLLGDNENILIKCMENILFMLKHTSGLEDRLHASTEHNYKLYEFAVNRHKLAVHDLIDFHIHNGTIQHEFSIEDAKVLFDWWQQRRF